MKILSGLTAAMLLVAAVMTSSIEAQGQGACDHGGSHTIQVRPGDGDVPELSYRGGSAEEVHVCVGDSVRWVLNGPDRGFFVEFFAGGLFDGATRRGSSGNVVEIVIAGSAERGQSYDYSVEFADGGEMDPRIIVD